MAETAEEIINCIQIENLSVCKAPLLKQYYWEYFEIDKLNAKLRSNFKNIVHAIHMPPQLLYALPYKIVLWVRSYALEPYGFEVKRIQKCECNLVETRVGFNQFRRMFHCPHRKLIHLLQDKIEMKHNDLVALKFVINFCIVGEHMLSFEFRCSDKRKILLNIFLDIVQFNPLKCVLTKELVPIDLKEYRRVVQPIWVRNITMQNLQFSFSAAEHGFKILNPNLNVPRQSVWPLMIEYRPGDYNNTISLSVAYCGRPFKVVVRAKAYDDVAPLDMIVPVQDYDCVDFPYVIYPNKLDFDMEMEEQRTKMVAIHNYSLKCVEFSWQKYEINASFRITFEPPSFRLKPHHSKLCRVVIVSHKRPLLFKCIPAILVIHSIPDKGLKLTRALLQELTPIDNPQSIESTYLQHIYLHINLKVNLKEESTPILELDVINAVEDDEMEDTFVPPKITIFEKLFWNYLAFSNYRREDKKVRDNMNYNEVIETLEEDTPLPAYPCKSELISHICKAMGYSLIKTSKNWRFVPPEFCDSEN